LGKLLELVSSDEFGMREIQKEKYFFEVDVWK
jgi:hypothetical protein